MTVLFVSAASFAATPGKIKYQGSLRENGVAVTGQRTVTFGLFTQAAGGTAVWESGDIAVNVSNGLFTCELTPGGGIDWSAGPYYLQVTVNGAVMVPREEITSTVYALQARSVDDGAVTAAKIADGAVSAAKLAAGSVTDEKVVSVSWSKITGVPASNVSTETVAGMQAEIAALKVSTGALAGQVSGKYDKTGGVLSGDLDATGYRITASTIGSPGTKLYGDGSGLTGLPGGGADNLGNHTATQALDLAGNAVVNVSSIVFGTAIPEFKLTLDSDGGIVAKGTFGSGGVLTSTGAGTRLIWYPRRAAFRAGTVNGAQWDVGNVAPYSVALGINTTASGMTSTAMGANATASGDVSTAIGYNTTASGNYSTAMGVGTTASGNYSTAMGNNTTASGVCSVAMGVGFTNERANSLGIGYLGVAGSTRTPDISLSPSSHSWLNAEVGNVGIGTINPEFKLTLDSDGGIVAKGTFGSGAVLTSTGAGTRLIWYPRKSAFRAGSADGVQWDDVNVGLYSTAFGYNTTASGYSSTAMGWDTTASAIGSTAMGRDTTASGNYSTAMGRGTTASGDYSTAIGYYTTASAIGSTAMGVGTTASGDYSTAMGWNTTASGVYSVAMGYAFTNPYGFSLGIGYSGVGTSTTTPDILLNPSGNSWLNAGMGYVLVRTTTPFTGRTEVFQVNGSGYASAWNTPSDQRLKKNIATISGALDRVQKLRGVTYEWKDPERHGGQTGRQMGFIAQEAKDVIPEVVSGGDDGEYAVAYGPVVALLVEAVKEQAAQNQRLEQRTRALEERLRALEQQLGVR